MKHGSFTVICLVTAAFIAVASVFGDEYTVNLESRILESFDGDSGYEWKAVASKFATTVKDESGETTDEYPRLTLIETWPQALFGTNRKGDPLKSLGIWGKFDRRGYNWIDIYPVQGGEEDPTEIPIPGRAGYLDMWVWGSNLNYYIEAYIRDYQGVVHNIRLGYIGYEGWKNLRANIPTSIPQAKRVLPKLASLSFVKFRLWTTPTEPVGNFYVYFDQFKVLTDTFESLYDGDELSDPERVAELWNPDSDTTN
jgi:hypothetical protein